LLGRFIYPLIRVKYLFYPIMKFRTYLSLAAFAVASSATANTICINSGSMGVEGDASNTDAVSLDQPGVVAAGGDFSSAYTGPALTTHSRLPFKSLLNSSAPFSIEFWARPTLSNNDNAPVDNRIATGNRSGWAFFQRATGWNFRMYNGNGSLIGFDLTGGTSTLESWSHVVATWDGATARLYVNGVFADVPNAGNGTAVYAPSTTATLTIGSLGDDSSPFYGRVDEVAFYGSALSAEKIAAHYNTVSSTVPGAYSNLVKADGAIVYYQQNPATISIAEEGANKVVSFTGVLSQSTDLTPGSWQDLAVTSPYTVTPTSGTPKLFFRAHR